MPDLYLLTHVCEFGVDW